MTNVELIVNAQRHRGWKSWRMTRSIESVAASFELGFVDHWLGRDEPLPIASGDACELAIGGDTRLAGYVDDDESSFDPNNYGLSVKGRSMTGQLVDCSIIDSPMQWRDRTIVQIAKDLCKPFSISVQADVDVGEPFRKFAVQPGETPFECIERAARQLGVLLTTDGIDTLVVTKAGTRVLDTVLEEGRNLKAGRRRTSWRDRHSEYVVHSQMSGTDEWHGRKAATPEARSFDSAVSYRRPLVIMAEVQGAAAELQKRADWERARRAARSERVFGTVLGHSVDGHLWEPNVRVPVRSKRLRIDATLLVVSVTLVEDPEGGRYTELEMARPEAYELVPVPPPKKGGGW